MTEIKINLIKNDFKFRNSEIFVSLLIFTCAIVTFIFALNFQEFLESINSGRLSTIGIICWFICPLINILLFPLSISLLFLSIYYLFFKPRFIFINDEYIEYKLNFLEDTYRIKLSEISRIDCNFDFINIVLKNGSENKISITRISKKNIFRLKKMLHTFSPQISFNIEIEEKYDYFKSIVVDENE